MGGLMDGKRVYGLSLHLDTLATVSGVTQFLTQGFSKVTKEELPNICSRELNREDIPDMGISEKSEISGYSLHQIFMGFSPFDWRQLSMVVKPQLYLHLLSVE